MCSIKTQPRHSTLMECGKSTASYLGYHARNLVRHRLPYHPVRDKVDTINNIETCHLYCGTFPSRPQFYLLLSSHIYVECPPLHHELSPTRNNAHLPRSEDKLLTHTRSIQPKHIRRNKPDIFRPKWEARPQMAHHPSYNQTPLPSCNTDKSLAGDFDYVLPSCPIPECFVIVYYRSNA